MSGETVVAKRYARALFEAAQAQNIIAQVEDELRAVVVGIRENADFRNLLAHPNVDTSVKVNLMNGILAGKVSDIVLRTVTLLLERGRQSVLPVLLEDYVRIANEALGQATAVVSTPTPLSEADAAGIAQRFGQLTGKTIRVENVIDPSLLGGMTVRIGDRLYDGSLSGKLYRLQQSLNATQAL